MAVRAVALTCTAPKRHIAMVEIIGGRDKKGMAEGDL